MDKLKQNLTTYFGLIYLPLFLVVGIYLVLASPVESSTAIGVSFIVLGVGLLLVFLSYTVFDELGIDKFAHAILLYTALIGSAVPIIFGAERFMIFILVSINILLAFNGGKIIGIREALNKKENEE